MIELFEQQGVVFPIRVRSDQEVSQFRDELEAVARDNPRRMDQLHMQYEWAYRLASHENVLDAVEKLIGPEILIDGNLVFHKPPHDEVYASWHQDSVYSGWHLTPSVSAWIALTVSEPANGCMRVIPGSHKQGVLEHENVEDPNLLNKRGERLRMDVDESQAVDVVLKPGEMSLHHPNIILGSNANTADGPRIGFIVRFVTNLSPNRDRPVMRVRGNADCSHLVLVQPPDNLSA